MGRGVMRDFYEILGVERNASADEIKSAYRKIALKNHPDRNKNNPQSEARFKEAAEAYSALADSEKRQRYDQFGHAGLNGAQAFGGGGGFSVDDIFSAFGDIFGGRSGASGIFDQFFGGGSAAGQARRGESLRVDLHLDLEEVLSGVEKTIQVERLARCESCAGSGAKAGTGFSTCSTCNGHGQVQQSQGFFAIRRPCPTCQGEGQVIKNPCVHCHGAGRFRQRHEKTFRIPAGIEEGHVQRLSGQGNAGEREGPNGDLLIVIHVKQHAFFERSGTDLYCKIDIRYPQAVLGGTVRVPTLDSSVEMKIPKGTPQGKILRLRGQGLPLGDGRSRGSLLVEIAIEIPKKLTQKQEELLREFDRIEEDRSPAGKIDPKEKGHGFFDKLKSMF